MRCACCVQQTLLQSRMHEAQKTLNRYRLQLGEAQIATLEGAIEENTHRVRGIQNTLNSTCLRLDAQLARALAASSSTGTGSAASASGSASADDLNSQVASAAALSGSAQSSRTLFARPAASTSAGSASAGSPSRARTITRMRTIESIPEEPLQSDAAAAPHELAVSVTDIEPQAPALHSHSK